MNDLQWKKYPVLNDGFVCLVDSMGDDSAIVQAARVSYGKDERDNDSTRLKAASIVFGKEVIKYEVKNPGPSDVEIAFADGTTKTLYTPTDDKKDKAVWRQAGILLDEQEKKDRNLIRYLMSHYHTTPFEMVEFKFLVRVPMDCWRQWIRHRTASVNEYSTRYTEAIDSQQTTSPQEWRLQARNNKQGSSGFLEEWPEDYSDPLFSNAQQANIPPGTLLSNLEQGFHRHARDIYEQRLKCGVAKEQARKDLPLSTYTEAYWKINLHNLFHFLRLRMDSHAQLEIRQYANAIAEIVKQVVPVAWEAFEDYRLNAKGFSAMEMDLVKLACNKQLLMGIDAKPDSMTDREWKEFKEKLS